MNKLVLMKYLDAKGLPRFRRITENEVHGTDEFRKEFMDLEKEEMLYSGEMSEHLWTKCLNKEEYKSLMDLESKVRLETLDVLIRVWEEV